MHRQLAWGDALARTDVAQQLAGQLGTLAIEHLPADDLAAEQILEQVQIKVLAAHLGGQVRDIPAEPLIGPGRDRCLRAAWIAAPGSARPRRRRLAARRSGPSPGAWQTGKCPGRPTTRA